MNEKSSNGMGEEPIRDFEQIKENAEQTNIKDIDSFADEILCHVNVYISVFVGFS